MQSTPSDYARRSCFDISYEDYEELTAENAALRAGVAALKEQVAVLLDELGRAQARFEQQDWQSSRGVSDGT